MTSEVEGAVERLTADLAETCPQGSKWPNASVSATDLRTVLAALRAQAEGERKPAPEPPWPAGSATNCKREGWAAFFAGLSRDACPFPPGRQDLQRGYREGWEAAAATQAENPQEHDDE